MKGRQSGQSMGCEGGLRHEVMVVPQRALCSRDGVWEFYLLGTGKGSDESLPGVLDLVFSAYFPAPSSHLSLHA